MWHLALTTALAHRARMALTMVAVALGVAFVAGSLALTDTSTRLLDTQFRAAAAGVDLTVRTAAAFDTAMGVQVQRDPLPHDFAARVAAVPGVARIRPAVTAAAHLQLAAATEPPGPALLGSWADAPFTAYRLESGHAPHGPGEVVLDLATAGANHVTIGDTVTVSATASRRLHVVGLTRIGDGDGLANTAVALVDLPTAQILAGLGTTVSSIDVIADDATDVTDLRARLARMLGAGYGVTSAQDVAAASADAAQQSIEYLRIVLLTLAVAGLVVGGFLIANTFGMLLSQRAGELALLRAAGATGRQVLAMVLAEALLVGAAGAVAGTGLGIAGAYALRDLAGDAGLAMPDGPLTITAATLLLSLLSGTAVTVLAALGPARRAARIAPVTAMRAADPAPSRVRRGRAITGWVLMCLAVLGLSAAATVRDVAGVGLGALLLLVSLGLLAPVLAPGLARVAGKPLQRLGVPGRLAIDATTRNPRRTASTASALGLGLALIAFVSVVGSSASAISAAGTEAVTADLVIQSDRNEMLGGLSPEVATLAAALPQVTSVTAIRFGHWLDGDMTSALTAVDPDGLPEAVRIRMAAGRLVSLDRGGVVITETVARERALRTGDLLTMTFPRDGVQQLRVAGVISDDSARALSTSYLISLATYRQHYTEDVDAAVYVTVRSDADQGATRAALRDAVADFPNAEILDQAEAAAARIGAIKQVLGLITVLLGFAVLIALLGITNTLALSIVERTREIGLLRAVGMTRAQLRAMVRAEAMLIAAVAAVAGACLGLGLGAATLAALAPGGTPVIQVPAVPLLAVIVGAVVAGLAAGLLPARRAARLDVLTAIATH